jgi:hypothetical protein
VIQTESSYWYDAGPRTFQAFPYHWLIQPGDQELKQILRQHKIISLRYSTPLQNTAGCISYHAVYDEPEYTIEGLDRRSRQNVRKGLKNCLVESIPLERLAQEGWSLEEDTAERQGRQTPLDQKKWYERYMAAAELPGFEAWGALVDGRLVASLLTFQMGDCCEMISQQCHQDFLNARVNNALTYTVTKTMIDRQEIKSVFYALHSLDAPSSVDTFKFRMGYRAKPVRQRVVFHPLLEPFANQLNHRIVFRLSEKYATSRLLAKAEGMLRFHNQGLQSLEKQDWPEILDQQKSQLLADL